MCMYIFIPSLQFSLRNTEKFNECILGTYLVC